MPDSWKVGTMLRTSGTVQWSHVSEQISLWDRTNEVVGNLTWIRK
jgi:hypothetical protein